MSDYNRVTTWIPGDVLTASALNTEFNTIQSVLNGGIDSDNIGTLETLNFVNNTANSAITVNGSGGTGCVLEVVS